MFSIDKRSSFNLKPPEFSCDQPIHKQIVPPLPCTPFFLTITGSAGSGKTSMLVNLLTSPQAYKKAFHAVHIIMPAHSVASLKKNIFAKHPHMHDELNFTTLDRNYEQVMKDSKEKMSSLLIMDDVTASLEKIGDPDASQENHFRSPAQPLIDNMPSAVLQRDATCYSKNDQPSRLLQTKKQKGNKCHIGGARVSRQRDRGSPSALRI